jgi:hypothetical protein
VAADGELLCLFCGLWRPRGVAAANRRQTDDGHPIYICPDCIDLIWEFKHSDVPPQMQFRAQ